MTFVEGLLILLAGVAGCTPWPANPPWVYGPRLSWLLIGVVGLLVIIRTQHG